ncbi:hypothetical protein F5883DRAFT_696506 [Diaporthe sp. PMI_573]|nr:hypothetical protein F5883DRAFT_696506 [Diaporthaceae sp. PMI_573]
MGGKYLLTGGYVATLDDALGDFPNGAVLVDGGLITAVGRAEDIVALDAEVIDTTGGVVMPGMIDTHRHSCISLFRGIGCDQGIFQFLCNGFTRYLPALTAEDLRLSALVTALEAIDSGVTTIVDPYDACRSHADTMAGLQGLEESGIRAFFCPSMTDEQYDDAEKGNLAHQARLAHIDTLYENNAAKASQLVRIGMSISHPGSVPFDKTEAEIKFANQRGMFCCSHSAPVKNSVLCGGVMERADRGLMLPGHLYIHCTNLTDHEFSLIAQTGGKVSVSVETEMQMGMGLPPLRYCLNHGIDPSLGLDTSSAVSPDLFGQMRLGLQLQRGLDSQVLHDKGKVVMKPDLTVHDAMCWATRNGAAALGLGDQIGTLTPGKRADVVHVSDDRALTPSVDPLGTTVLHSSAADVDTVLIDGRVRKRYGRLVEHDRAKVRAQTNDATKRIMAHLDNLPPEMLPEQLTGGFRSSETSTRINLGKAYASSSTSGSFV